MTNDFVLASSSDTLCITSESALRTWMLAAPQNADTLATSNDASLVNPFGNNNINPDFRPQSVSPATSGALFTNAKLLPISTVSIDESNTTAAIAVYPNPASDNVTITLGKGWNGEMTVQILDLNGRTVVSNNHIATENSVINTDISNLVSGIYLVRISNATASQVTKLIVQ